MEVKRTSLIRRRRSSSWDIEKAVVTALITSDKVLSSVIPILDTKLFTLDAGKIISSWCKTYYEKYNKAPGSAIQNIFQAEKDNIKEEEQTLIADFLQSLSNEYIENPPNEEYMADQAVDYLRKNKILQLSKQAQGIIETGGSVQEAEQAITKYRTFNKQVPRFKNPIGDVELLNRAFETLEDPLFLPTGDMAKLTGPLRRGMLFGIMGPMKRGKTWVLIDLAMQALRARRRVVFISLEMTTEQMAMRFYQYLGSYGQQSDDLDKIYTFPTVDCKYNQDNSCKRAMRTCSVSRPRGLFEIGQTYVPCSACRGMYRSSFKPIIYNVKESRPTIRQGITREMVKNFEFQYGSDFLRIIGYPAYSANLNTIMGDIDGLESDGFIPDVILIDYPDILAPEDDRKENIHQVDETWKVMKSISQQRQCLIVAPTQGSRKSFKKALMEAGDTPWDIRKLAHVDLMMCLNQTDDEKEKFLMRFNIIAHRWVEFFPNRVYLVCQQLAVGQPHLDGYITFQSDRI